MGCTGAWGDHVDGALAQGSGLLACASGLQWGEGQKGGAMLLQPLRRQCGHGPCTRHVLGDGLGCVIGRALGDLLHVICGMGCCGVWLACPMSGHTDNSIGDEGGKAIGKALEVNAVLTSLNLHCMCCLCRDKGWAAWGFEGVVCVGNEEDVVRGLQLWWTVVGSGLGGAKRMGGPVEWFVGAVQCSREWVDVWVGAVVNAGEGGFGRRCSAGAWDVGVRQCLRSRLCGRGDRGCERHRCMG